MAILTQEANRARGQLTLHTLIDLAYRHHKRGVTPEQFARQAPWWPEAEREATTKADGTLALSLPFFLLSVLGAFRMLEMYELTEHIHKATHDEWKRAAQIAIGYEPDLAEDIEDLVTVCRLERILCWELLPPWRRR